MGSGYNLTVIKLANVTKKGRGVIPSIPVSYRDRLSKELNGETKKFNTKIDGGCRQCNDRVLRQGAGCSLFWSPKAAELEGSSIWCEFCSIWAPPSYRSSSMLCLPLEKVRTILVGCFIDGVV